ncbi:FecR family protein [Catenovulum sediminis]|uniref:FecR domain-containing protein n=1 Tax=Catenovulum sediminis TaxID=1740262 RepID=A0ABV1RBU6_9ALTE
MKSFEEFEQSMSKLESEAWDWIIRLDADEPMTAREKSKLIEWLSTSPAHIEQIRKINEFWGDTLLAELAISAKQRKSKQGKAKQKKGIQHSWLNPAYGFSFTFLLVICLVVATNWIQPSGVEKTSYLNQEYLTKMGQQKNIDLSDGSKIILNSGSQMRVFYSDRSRDIWLMKGEAYFAVAKDPSRPFSVYANKGRVEAVGTAFSVDLRPNGDINVVVTEGRIALSKINGDMGEDNNKRLTQAFVGGETSLFTSYKKRMKELTQMEAGEYITLLHNIDFQQTKAKVTQNIRKLSEIELEADQAWRNGELVFTGQTLVQVVNELERYTTEQIIIDDPAIESLQIGGRFRANQTDTLFENLKANFNLKIVKKSDGKVIISKP